MISYWNNYPTIQNKLQAVCSYLEKNVAINNEIISKTLVDFARSGGKLLRPALCLLFAELNPNHDEEKMTKIAASLEMLHMATLIHDDIIDDSPLRRGAITVQAQFGKDIAVYAGDVLFTKFFETLISVMNGSEYLAYNARTMRRILMGELNQMTIRFKIDEKFTDYLRSINGKTAELFYLACKEGAYFSGCSPQVVRLASRIGRNIGLAFQIYDDILDYTADKATLKKPILEDLGQGIYTLPLILVKDQYPEIFAPYLNKKNQITQAEIEEVAKLVVQYGGVEQAKVIAQKITKKALEDIKKLPDGIAKDNIHQLTMDLLNRQY